ncbi:MAG: MBOAT family protein [Oscillospiraceae bacterium]|nr:MBOAT family protein [Oscillospiraceae bacterium]
MLFTSYEFLGFLAALFLLYYVLPKRLQQPLLLAASYVFYFIAKPVYLLYILTTTATTYYAARRIGDNLTRQSAYLKEHKAELDREAKKAYKEGQKRVRRKWVAACLLVNLGILAVVKYTNFVIANINGVISAFGGEGLSFVNLALPLGISFYTFQAVGYLIDVYRGTVPAERNLPRFALFISFFPQLIQGPISRYGDLSATLCKEHAFDGKQAGFGLQRMLWGYFKKMVVADRVLAAVMTIVGDPETYRGAYILVGMVFYTLQLYADFTGGIDITIGIAQVLGVKVQENFIRPYFSKSLKEYWRRWHVSMSSWFRDYLFYPVSTSKVMQKFTRFAKSRMGEKAGKRLPVYLSMFVVWFATGVWHGASWNFIVWGLGNWVVLMASEELEPLYAKFHQRFHVDGKFWYRLFQVGRTFLLVCVLNLFDCYPSLSLTFGAFASLFTAGNWSVLWNGSLMALGLSALDYGILAAGVALMLAVSVLQRGGSVREKIAKKPYPVRFVLWYGLFLIVLLMGAYGVGYDASQFIYNQF